MTMTKKYAICEVHTLTRKYIQLLNYDEYCATTCYIKVIEESDDYDYIRNIYDEKYDNRYVTDTWLTNNGYIVDIVETFGGSMKRYTNKVKDTKIEIIFIANTEIVGYQVKFSKPMKTMEINDRGTLLTIENFNVMFNLFN